MDCLKVSLAFLRAYVFVKKIEEQKGISEYPCLNFELLLISFIYTQLQTALL